MIKRLCLAIISWTFFCNQLVAQEWQWSAALDTLSTVTGKQGWQAYLWIPPGCRQVRGTVITSNNTIAEGIFERENFRSALDKIGFAEIWVKPGTGPGNDSNLPLVLKSLADKSGYTELEFVALLPVLNASSPGGLTDFDDLNRILAGISVCDADGMDDKNSTILNRDIMNTHAIPWLFAIGRDTSTTRLTIADDTILHPISMRSIFQSLSACFSYTEEAIDYLAMYITKAAQYRLPGEVNHNEALQLTRIDPGQGWLIDGWRKDSLVKAAAFKDYAGDKMFASWSFDEEMAKTTQKFCASANGRQLQAIGFMQESAVIKPSRNNDALTASLIPSSDGISFHLSAFFSDNSKIDLATAHAKTPILLERISGPVKKIDDTSFRLNFARHSLSNLSQFDTIRLLASAKADELYQEAIQELTLVIPSANKEGKVQKINFPAIPDQREGIRYLQMTGRSDAGLPVNYYIQEGPAEIQGRAVKFLPVPLKGKFPVKITVVAWQYGSTTEPAVQSAEPVVQSFYLVK